MHCSVLLKILLSSGFWLNCVRGAQNEAAQKRTCRLEGRRLVLKLGVHAVRVQKHIIKVAHLILNV